MKRFEELSNKTQHKRVDELLGLFESGVQITEIAKQLDEMELSQVHADTWRGLKPRWINFGWIN